MGVFFLVQIFTQQTFLFASLASSAFLIYKEPDNAMNQVKKTFCDVRICLASSLPNLNYVAGVALTKAR